MVSAGYRSNRSVRQNHGCRCIAGDPDLKSITRIRLLPTAFYRSINALVAGFRMGKVSAGFGRDHEVIFTIHTNTAHGLEQPLTYRSLGIVV